MIAMEDEIITERIEELLKMELGLSSYEARVFYYITKTSNIIPTEIVKATSVPQSKIYGVLKNLHARNLIEKNEDGYSFNSSVLPPIQSKFSELFSALSSHLDSIIQKYSITENAIVQKLTESLQKLRYNVESTGRLDSFFKNEKSYPNSLLERTDKSALPQLIIATSSTSVNRVGILIFTDGSSLKKMENIYLIREILHHLNLDKKIILIDDVSEKIKNYFHNVTFVSLLGNYPLRIAEELETFDKTWRRAINVLKSLNDLVDKPYRRINRLSGKIAEIRFLIRQIENDRLNSEEDKSTLWVANAFYEIIDRVDADIKSSNDFYLELKLVCMSLQHDLTEKKTLPKTSEIKDIENDVHFLIDELDDLELDLSALLDEVLNILRGVSYQKIGFIANPFVFTIPIQNSLQVIGQDGAIEQLSEFITNISTSVTRNNLALIVDEQGMGKTHLMTYFLDKINNNSFPNTSGLFIRCKPNNDFFTIYNEIRVAVEKLPDSPLKMGLHSILSKSDYPLTINQFSDVLRNLSQIAFELGETNLIFFIDEFENLFSSETESKAAAQQLRYLSETPHVGFVVSLRKSDWDGEPHLRKILSESSPTFISLKRLDFDSIKTILNNRIELLSTEVTPKITFDPKTIEAITKKSQGNIRKAFTLAREAFRKTVHANKTKITPEMIVDDSTKSDDSNSVTELHLKKKEVKE